MHNYRALIQMGLSRFYVLCNAVNYADAEKQTLESHPTCKILAIEFIGAI